jgi:hypothetical protein
MQICQDTILAGIDSISMLYNRGNEIDLFNSSVYFAFKKN